MNTSGTTLRMVAAVALALASWCAQAQTPASAASAASAPQEGARPEVAQALQAAQQLSKEGKYADAMAKVREAAAAPNLTPYESFFIERMRAAMAMGTGDLPLALQSLDKVVASGRLAGDELRDVLRAQADLYYRAKDYAKAAAAAQRYFQQGGSDANVRTEWVNALYLSGDYAAAAKELSAKIQAEEAAGQVPTEQLLRMLASAQAKTNDEAGYTQTLQRLVAHYPKPELWTDLIYRTQGKANLSDAQRLDLYRLRMATGAMEQPAEYVEMAQLAIQAGYPAEASKVLDAGYANGMLGKGANAKSHDQLRAQARRLAAADEPTLKQAAANPPAGRDGNSLAAMGFALATAGQPDKGAALIEQALGKGGIKRPDEARLHLGIAQWMAGQKDAAAQTFRSLKGNDATASQAQLWALLAQSPAVKTAQQ